MDTLEPIEPKQAVELYLNAKQSDVTEKTLDNIQYDLSTFTKWCDEKDIENMNDVSGRSLHEYRLWRQDDDVSDATVRKALSSVRVFIRWCESIDAVPEGLADKILVPSANSSRDEKLAADDAAELLAYLRKYEYATREHTMLMLLWHTGIRLGTLRSFDLDDYHPRKQTLDVRHRPETDTPLKNQKRAERTLAVSDEVATVLSDYIDVHRKDSADDYDRKPLFTSVYGRVSESGVKETCYRLTRPCTYRSCPHDRTPDDCEATESKKESKCPSSVSPHPIRRGSITHHLLNDVPQAAVSDRCNVSSDVLDKHYDRRTKDQKAEQRREYIDGL